MNKYGLIMAGGVGQRLYPLSTVDKPKQFMKLLTDDTMLDMTYKRVKDLVDDVWVSSCYRYEKFLIESLVENHFLVPESRGTAPLVCLMAQDLFNLYGDGLLMVSPSDHYIKDVEEFERVVKLGFEICEKENVLVMIGEKARYPEIEFGYCKDNNFVQKPNKKEAYFLYKNGYSWCTGVWIFRLSVILKEFEKFSPFIYRHIKNGEDYVKLQTSSLEGELMQVSENIKVLDVDMGWNDIGNFNRLVGLWDKEKLKLFEKRGVSVDGREET